MGKKGRRTRWRTLSITDEHSDSEESNTTTSGHRVPKGYPQKSYYSRFTYSSQSTPTRRYQCDGTKSTRSSSTASENKTTFNEDEYTRITTPRQDVLFKKGYLNKPKTYQTQTSTGNSTTSTGNSTGNGTPDHQSTDLEYESQFVFPNGFVDQNGIYYVNSFEPYPVMVYNPPTYYPEYTNVKTKRSSTGSLTESTSPNNEETETSQDLSQSETPSNVSDVNHVYNVVYPGYYYSGDACQPQDAAEPEPCRVKKRKRRKVSRSKQDGTTSESSDEIFSDEEETKTEVPTEEVPPEKPDEAPPEKPEAQTEDSKPAKYDLKPDAEEFVPRAYRHPETIPMEANVQFIKIPSNFVPVPIMNPMGEFNAFIQPGIPINFIPQNFVNFVPYKHPMHEEDEKEEEKKEEAKETVDVPKNQIDIARIVSKLEEAAKEQDETKEETKSVARKRHKYQKVELRKEERKTWTKTLNSPKKEEPPKPVRNYSDTLKKTIVQTNVRPDNADKTKTNKIPTKDSVAKNHERAPRTPPKSTDEWISVSRKKRKNKNEEKTENEEEIKATETIEVEIEATETIEVELPLVVEVETPPPPEPTPPPVVPDTKPPTPPPVVTETKPEEKKAKKKTKKSQAKPMPPPVTRRVIITDVDLSEVKKEEEETKPAEEEATVVEEPKNEKVEETTIIEEEKNEDETTLKEPEKKSKKKKKKAPTKVSIPSRQSSTDALNVTDDSYDFLLDESLEKTNVEVSQELDKLIQRGMYSNLEEKIKAMNIDSNDSFFKSIITNISSRESSVEKTSAYIKNPNFSRMSNPTLLKPLDRKAGDFLAEPTTLGAVGGGDAGTAADDSLYPITKAVKEWMTRTRENTPDVEILKSPSTIFKEFGGEEEEATVCSRKTSTSSVEEAEEVLEDYESVDEEYLKIQAEVQELRNKYPKHGNLPYRAICCSIM